MFMINRSKHIYLKRIKYNYLILLLPFFICSCYMEKKIEIVVVANDGNSPLLIVKQPDQFMTDSMLYHGYVSETLFHTGEIKTISLPIFSLRSLPDSEKMYLLIFNLDSVRKIRNEQRIDGIVRKSLIKKVSVQLNKVDDDLDTVYLSK